MAECVWMGVEGCGEERETRPASASRGRPHTWGTEQEDRDLPLQGSRQRWRSPANTGSLDCVRQSAHFARDDCREIGVASALRNVGRVAGGSVLYVGELRSDGAGVK
jgi:hypothetical protein